MNLVSICIPTFNGEEFLDECIQSACRQTYSRLEILLVDDCSSDGTLDLARRYAAKDSRIAIHLNPANLGLVGNWNRCIQLANGEWVKFLFQDDILHPDCVEKLVEEGARRKALLVGCERDFIYDGSISTDMRAAYERNRLVIREFLAPNRGASGKEYAARICRRLNYNYFGEPTVALIHRDAFRTYGLFRDELKQICDLEYWARVGGQVGLAFVPEVLCTFRAHGSGTSATNRKSKSFLASGLDPLRMINWMLEEDAYEVLRSNWAQAGVLEDIRRQRWNRANEVLEFVNSNGDGAIDAHTVRDEYLAFIEKYPGCGVSWWQHMRWASLAWPLRWKYRCGQFLNPLLPRSLRREKELPF